ncbi:MAG: sulfotransferase family 2 domain-containing protein [Candidatus Omnitrophota bacterium]|nr:sulfotransferase family 2 domain-containing protein [Candidatus Omnitrophota bacterium]
MNAHDPLYIFFHIHKTAGTTFAMHLQENLAGDERLAVYLKSVEVDAFNDSLAQMPPAQKGRLKVIYGHRVYDGIHKHFNREARYFTFLRDPVARTLSHYNGQMQLLEKRHYKKTPGLPFRPQPFKEWLFSDTSQWNAMAQELIRVFLQTHVVREEMNETHLNTAKGVLDRFFFVGATEHYEEDASYLYNLMGITKFVPDCRVTLKSYYEGDPEEARQWIRQKAPLDVALYSHALRLRRRSQVTT